jgi:H+/Cl- antiporter ClcA
MNSADSPTPAPPPPWALWLVAGAISGVLSGLGAAAFLWLLELATDWRVRHEAVVYGLPLAGACLGAIWLRFGESIRRGNDLVIETIVAGGARLPLRMAPMVLLGSVTTHLFGGSAGREGAAVQIGASLSDELAHRLRAAPQLRRQLVAAGAAGGFGAVFGTPLAGWIFGIELVGIRRADPRALVPCLVAAFVGDFTTHSLGIDHTLYPRLGAVSLDALLIGKWLAFAAGVAAVTALFIELLERLKRFSTRRLPWPPLRLFCGGLCVVGLWRLAGTSDYLGLGVPGILRAFTDPELPYAALAWKIVFTCVTLGAGFMGGEVTPLFFIGAVTGNLLARLLGIPLELGAGVGLAATFAAAAKAPLSLTIMALELFGAAVAPHAAIVCFAAAWLVGRRSVYTAQLS